MNRRRARASRRRHSASTPAASSARSGRTTTTRPSRSVSSEPALPTAVTPPSRASGGAAMHPQAGSARCSLPERRAGQVPAPCRTAGRTAGLAPARASQHRGALARDESLPRSRGPRCTAAADPHRPACTSGQAPAGRRRTTGPAAGSGQVPACSRRVLRGPRHMPWPHTSRAANRVRRAATGQPPPPGGGQHPCSQSARSPAAPGTRGRSGWDRVTVPGGGRSLLPVRCRGLGESVRGTGRARRRAHG